MTEKNGWTEIPLGDYEQHMQHIDVGQAQLLNSLTKKYLRNYNPKNILFLGISGGNGLEYIDVENTTSVVCIDINKSYLDETRKRFGQKIHQLKLINLDINSANKTYLQADFVWGALILEYVNVKHCLEFIQLNTAENAILVITIQCNNGVASISKTGIKSLNLIKEIFTPVDKDELKKLAIVFGFSLLGEEEHVLASEKSFFTLTFLKKPLANTFADKI